MKKIIGVVCLLFVFLISTNQKASASGNVLPNDFTIISSETEYLEDGSYLVYETFEQKSDIVLLATSYYKIGTRNVTRYDSNNKVQWIYTLSAEYYIEEGISATCTKADYSTTINNSNWKFSDGSTSYSGNTAYGKGKFTHKILFITTKTETIDIHLSCDSYGNLS